MDTRRINWLSSEQVPGFIQDVNNFLQLITYFSFIEELLLIIAVTQKEWKEDGELGAFKHRDP